MKHERQNGEGMSAFQALLGPRYATGEACALVTAVRAIG